MQQYGNKDFEITQDDYKDVIYVRENAGEIIIQNVTATSWAVFELELVISQDNNITAKSGILLDGTYTSSQLTGQDEKEQISDMLSNTLKAYASL